MKQEVLNAAPQGLYANVSSVAKTALMGPSTQPALITAKQDIQSLVTSKQIQVQDNLHLLLGTPNRSFDQPGANGTPVAYHDFISLQIFAKKLP